MKILVDKIASVTKNIPLEHEVKIQRRIKSEEGAVIVVEALMDKKIYNQLELTSGRMSTMQKGDILVVALGSRRALKGFVGEVPKKLKVGDVIHILNLGGVAGICTSANVKEVGNALKVRVLGAVLSSKGKPLNIKDYKLFEPIDDLKMKVPIIVVSGTCMNVGKTSIACEIIKSATRKGLTVYSAKLAGIAALKDTENMKDYGAKKTVSIVDAGFTSTVISPIDSVRVTKGALQYLAKDKPDLIVVEFGDGVLGEYGVLEILSDPQVQQSIRAHVGCAHDPAGALMLYEICKSIGAPLDVISGPVTDNSVGISFISKHLKITGFNALNQGEKVFPFLRSYLKK